MTKENRRIFEGIKIRLYESKNIEEGKGRGEKKDKQEWGEERKAEERKTGLEPLKPCVAASENISIIKNQLPIG